jgi:hypothetical protein
MLNKQLNDKGEDWMEKQTRSKTVYDEIFNEIVNMQQRVSRELEQTVQTDDDFEVKEQLNRTAFALQVTRDILENRVAPDKKITFTYAHGELTMKGPKL